jgi:hypothetical protein
LFAEWHDASVSSLTWKGGDVRIELEIWISDEATRRCRLHPVALQLKQARIQGPLQAGYEVMSGWLVTEERRFDSIVPMPFTASSVTLHLNEGCGGPLAPVTLEGQSLELAITGAALCDETMP